MPLERKDRTNEFGKVVAVEVTYRATLGVGGDASELEVRIAKLAECIDRFENVPKVTPMVPWDYPLPRRLVLDDDL